jgi:hypothetical protein
MKKQSYNGLEITKQMTGNRKERKTSMDRANI